MTTSKRFAERKVAKFQKNITRRGSVPETSSKKGNDLPVGRIVLGFFVFVVVGSCMICFFLSSSHTHSLHEELYIVFCLLECFGETRIAVLGRIK
ncbi:hypothetical protein EUGRSUZ_D01442 [Eucalyptus grandis]|uniref:Uncharacterized protein n=2 Tax=Eucalyptus grandis TaxID=71139 RepID=A0ACC3L4B4_EUCGR|nr:hypothetical protein EUGRSUZ_D01442 [Eucalyptus grandis]